MELKALRQRQGMTQQELADAIGVQRNTISRYEKGEREPDNNMLIKLADFFNVSTDYLLGKEAKKDHPQEWYDEIEEMTDAYLSGLTDTKDGTLMLSGKPATQAALDYLRAAIRSDIEYAKRLNEQENEGEADEKSRKSR